MFTITVGDYAITVQRGSLPAIYDDYKKHATLVEEFHLRPRDGELCFLSVSHVQHWPFLVVAQRFEMSEGGFDPGALVIPETKTVFLGAGRRLLAYQLDPPQRLWEDTTDAGFLEWSRHGDTVLMSGELELIAYDLHGSKRWTMPLEPAWAYNVTDDMLHLNVMGRHTGFPLKQGPEVATLER